MQVEKSVPFLCVARWFNAVDPVSDVGLLALPVTTVLLSVIVEVLWLCVALRV